MYIYVQVYILTHTHIYVHRWIYIYIYIYTHISIYYKKARTVRPKVDLADVAVLQHRLVARVWCPVCGHMVDRAAGRESDPRAEPILLNQSPVDTRYTR